MKLLFQGEFEMTETFLEAMRDWVRLEELYARELGEVRKKLGRIQSGFE